MYAVVNTGGKQAKVTTDAVIAVEKLDAEVGQTVALPVLMVSDGEKILATPADLAGASVTVEVLEHFKGEKQIVFKFKKRKGYKRTNGHRQLLTSVRVLEISTSGASVKPAKAAKPAAEPKPTAKAAKPAVKKSEPKAEKVVVEAKATVAKPAKADKPATEPKVVKAKAEAKPAKAAEKPAKKAAEKPAKAAAPVEAAQCEAVKSDGSRCTNKAKDGSKYCGVHAKKLEG